MIASIKRRIVLLVTSKIGSVVTAPIVGWVIWFFGNEYVEPVLNVAAQIWPAVGTLNPEAVGVALATAIAGGINAAGMAYLRGGWPAVQELLSKLLKGQIEPLKVDADPGEVTRRAVELAREQEGLPRKPVKRKIKVGNPVHLLIWGLLPACLLSGCVGPGERIRVPTTINLPNGVSGEKMTTAYENGNDNFGPSKITVTKGEYSITVDRSFKTGYEGKFATKTTQNKDGSVVTTQEPLMASQRPSYAWEAFGNFLVKGGKAGGAVATPIVGLPVAGGVLNNGIGMIPKP